MGFPGEESLVFNFCPREGLFSATGVRRTPSKGEALALAANAAGAIRVETTGQWGPRADVSRSSSQRASLALAAKTAEAMRTVTDQWGPCANVRRSPRQGAALAVAAKAHYLMKVHHVSLDLEEGTQEAPSDSAEDEAQHAIGSRGRGTGDAIKTRRGDTETLEAPSDPKEETRAVLSNHEEEAKHATGSTEVKGHSYSRVGGSPSVAIFRQIRRTSSRRVHAGVEGVSPQIFLPTNEEGNEESVPMSDEGGMMVFQRKMELPEPIVRGVSPEQ